jgi:peptidyl-prolyl cis-trans isomerase D
MQIVFNTVDEAKKAKEKIAAGIDFLDIAKERGFTPQEVTLGTLAKNEIFDTKIAEAAFKVPAGTVSDPVQGQLSIVLLKVVTATPEHQATFEEAKADLMQKLQLEKAAESLRSIYDSVEDARAGQTPFEEIAKKFKIPFILIASSDAAGLDKDGKAVTIPDKDELLKRSFESDVGVENEPIPTASDGYIWYEVRALVPARPRPLETVKDKVKADLIAKKLREFALDRAKKLVERSSSGIGFDALAKEAGAELKTVAGLKRNETNAELDAAAVSALFSLPEKKVGYAPANDGKSAKVIEVAKVVTPKFDAKEAGVATMRKTLADDGGADVLDTYQNALQGNLGVTVNENLWRQIAGTP